MCAFSVEIKSPKAGAKFSLGTSPVQSELVKFEALVRDGQRELTSQAQITWKISWAASSKVFSYEVATGAVVSVPLTVGGEFLHAIATIEGETHETLQDIIVRGTNPSQAQIKRQIGDSDLICAICWQESTWHQFTKRGLVLQNSEGRACRGLGQVCQTAWANNRDIDHNEYQRICWQWDYNIEAVRDIVAWLQTHAHTNYPNEAEECVLNRAIKAYKAGYRSFKNHRDPLGYSYVVDIRRLLTKEPWLGGLQE